MFRTYRKDDKGCGEAILELHEGNISKKSLNFVNRSEIEFNWSSKIPEFNIKLTFNTDNIKLNIQEAKKMRNALNSFINNYRKIKVIKINRRKL